MRRVSVSLLTVALIALCVFVFTDRAVGEETQRGFVGAAKCKTCHKTAAQGEQFPVWEKSQHAKAYATLASEEAMKVAKERGIENPQEADECLKCHVTGHGVAEKLLGAKYAVTDGVGCESCHGAGADYYKKATMVGIADGSIEAASVGLIKPDEKTCLGCHNEESPSFKGFNFKEAVAKIAHPIPEERKATYTKAEQ